MKKRTLDKIIEVAQTLFDPEDQGHTEYARGVCELIGRIRLDIMCQGEGTFENAIEVAKQLNVKIYPENVEVQP